MPRPLARQRRSRFVYRTVRASAKLGGDEDDDDDGAKTSVSLNLAFWHGCFAAFHLCAFTLWIILFYLAPHRREVVHQLTFANAPVFAPYDLVQVTLYIQAFAALSHIIQAYAYPKSGANPLKWMEYAVSNGLLVWTSAALLGISDILTLVTIGPALNLALQLSGYLFENHNFEHFRQRVPQVFFRMWGAFTLGGLVALAQWLPQFVFLFEFEHPFWVWWAVLTLFSKFLYIPLWIMCYWHSWSERIMGIRISPECYELGFMSTNFFAKASLTSSILYVILV